MTWFALIGRWLISPMGRAFLLMAALLGALWWFRSSTWDRATEEAEGKHAVAMADAAAAQREYERKRDQVAREISDTTREQARAASQEVQTQTTASRERIRTVMQRVEVPANCPQGPEPVVIEELNAMIDRANAASQNRKQRRAGR